MTRFIFNEMKNQKNAINGCINFFFFRIHEPIIGLLLMIFFAIKGCIRQSIACFFFSSSFYLSCDNYRKMDGGSRLGFPRIISDFDRELGLFTGRRLSIKKCIIDQFSITCMLFFFVYYEFTHELVSYKSFIIGLMDSRQILLM